ncbi:4-hydroxyphenylacetate 3-monooxygenase oxygenase component [Alicyclobacillus contaminans]|uniref:4-hydroxyphenylacetate 3-hydroxylase family protein n=1 Tax=Alicyclobacillus contaminans TaxID=392016 RepID=UPI0004108678|nr:4-hydroxyphenylacetate 3-hydroxylase N-terminal domain-containing protein [Alicyclobacillus contaminans]GMA49866.1 4-hydroxyphenylacetate 3-monooxygenase oxygenase component [Alicyclobacillus contaminans]
MTRGQRFLNSLNDGRTVWLDGQQVPDVTRHPAFTGTLETIARLFDSLDTAGVREQIGFPSPRVGQYAHNAFLVPRTREDLARRTAAFTYWAEQTHGVMSRLSDYARSMVTGWYAVRDAFSQDDPHFADKISRYYEAARDQDLFLTTALLDPQINRAKRIDEENPDAVLRIVSENHEGVVVRGAKMIATAAPYTHDFLIFPFHHVDSAHPQYAHALIVPANLKGLHIVCRESFASVDAVQHPLSSRYDEMDAVLIFDDVLVPWERVLLKDNPEAVWRLRQNTSANALAFHQTVVRAAAKLRFVAGVACAIAESIGVDGFLHVQEKLGELLTQVDTLQALAIASEVHSYTDDFGNQIPAIGFLETARNLNSRYYPRAIEILQQIGAGGFMQVPSQATDYTGSVSQLIDKYFAGARVSAEAKIKLFQLGWDLIGSQLGARHQLYERYYAGDPVRTFANQYVNADKARYTKPVWDLIRQAGV